MDSIQSFIKPVIWLQLSLQNIKFYKRRMLGTDRNADSCKDTNSDKPVGNVTDHSGLFRRPCRQWVYVCVFCLCQRMFLTSANIWIPYTPWIQIKHFKCEHAALRTLSFSLWMALSSSSSLCCSWVMMSVSASIWSSSACLSPCNKARSISAWKSGPTKSHRVTGELWD